MFWPPCQLFRQQYTAQSMVLSVRGMLQKCRAINVKNNVLLWSYSQVPI